MKQVIVRLKGVGGYSQSGYYEVPKLSKEGPDAYEQRTWRERMHVTEDGHVFIPPMAFKKAITSAASMLGLRIKGRNMATYARHFKSGILVESGPILPDEKDKVVGEPVFVDAKGRAGGGTRVKRIFPLIPEWEALVTFLILDNTITEDVFLQHLVEAGRLIGIGRFRPENGGTKGRFTIVGEPKWQDLSGE